MSTISIRIPDSLHQRLREYAAKEGVSINQFITSAALEKIAVLSTVELLESRGLRASRSKFEAALRQVPDTEPDEADR